MRRMLVTSPLLLAACSTMAPAEPEIPVRGATPGYTCRSEGLERFAGQQATEEVGAEILRSSGARTLRWVPHGTIVTMEFREDRVTAWLDANNRIERVNCG